MDDEPVPAMCYKGCQRNCGCRQAGHCSPICTSCKGLCDNFDPSEDSSDIDAEETNERDRGERPLTLTMKQSDPEQDPMPSKNLSTMRKVCLASQSILQSSSLL
uniref:Uncharacterized protein LOC114337628 n=1 Tax=Diabrotica virgifera virgifera TaxID=50390 RepID=A0A6P7GJH2_DIAVI